MTVPTQLASNPMFIKVSGAELPEFDGLYIGSEAPPANSEPGVTSSKGYWNDTLPRDRADGKAERSPAISYSKSYKYWRIRRLDGHMAYETTCDD